MYRVLLAWLAWFTRTAISFSALCRFFFLFSLYLIFHLSHPDHFFLIFFTLLVILISLLFLILCDNISAVFVFHLLINVQKYEPKRTHQQPLKSSSIFIKRDVTKDANVYTHIYFCCITGIHLPWSLLTAPKTTKSDYLFLKIFFFLCIVK